MKTVQFPVKESDPCRNMKQLIDLADSGESLNVLEEISENLKIIGSFLPGEYGMIAELIKKRRGELSRPKRMEPQPVNGPGLYLYYPEMGESRPECQIVAQRSYYGKHFHISTPLFLKGRGITYDGIREAKNLSESKKYMAGWNEYTVIERAFDKLQEKYSISQEGLLD